MSKLHWVSTLVAAVVLFGCQAGGPADEAAGGQWGAAASLFTKVAEKPPLGWNSFDSYDCRINEQEFRSVVDWFDANLKEYGWEYVVVDYIWFNPEPGNWDNPNRRFGHPDLRLDENGEPLDKLVMDEWGRLLPSAERFPSAADGQGFKPLAGYVHGKGLKFGIHIMRGIPRQAYYEDLPIKGTNYTAKDIAEPHDHCPWCNNMFGIDSTKPGAQEYMNSIFELYASWGVDFVKADDMKYRMRSSSRS
jgi:hypothetical protein